MYMGFKWDLNGIYIWMYMGFIYGFTYGFIYGCIWDLCEWWVMMCEFGGESRLMSESWNSG